MLDLSAAAKLEKNKLASDGAYLILLSIKIGDISVDLVRNTEDIEWAGKTWTAFPFGLSDVKQTSDGEIPELTLQISNVNRIMQSYVEKAHGGVDSTVRLYVVNSKLLNEDALLEEYFSVTKVDCDENNVEITLGVGYGKTRRPLSRYMKDYCSAQYGSCRCGVSADVKNRLPGCNHTLTDCRARNNSLHFGGCPMIGQGGLYL